jgi:hypothetical protein
MATVSPLPARAKGKRTSILSPSILSPPALAGTDVERGLVGAGDRGDDRQPETESGSVPDAVLGEGLEGSEQAVDLAGGHRRPGVGDHESGLVSAGFDEHPCVTVRSVVAQRVIEQIRHQPSDQVPIAGDPRRRERDVEANAVCDGLRLVPLDDLADDVPEVDRTRMVDPALTLGKFQKRVDQLLLLLAFFEHMLTCRPERLDACLGVAQDHLEQSAGGGQRCAQFVRSAGWSR